MVNIIKNPFRIVATPYSAKNDSSSVTVPQYGFFVFTVFLSNLVWLWIAIAFEMNSKTL